MCFQMCVRAHVWKCVFIANGISYALNNRSITGYIAYKPAASEPVYSALVGDYVKC